jgi:FkbM family methyltransferase
MQIMKSYSQNKEDLEIVKYFGDFQGKLLDIGANDGKTLSNSRLLIENGWSAFLIEPAAIPFRNLKELYKPLSNVFCFNIAIGNENKDVDFWESGKHLTDKDSGLLSTVSESETKRWKKEVFEKKTVSMFTFQTFRQMASLICKGCFKFDFINIDAEGLDLDILKQIDLESVEAKCVCIEHNSNQKIKSEILNYCSKFGLSKVLLDNAENIILVK